MPSPAAGGQPAQHQNRQPGIEKEMHPPPEFMPRFRGSGRLEGKVAIVTGGDSGIGRAVAVLFAREGANVAICYLDETADARETARLVKDEGAACMTIAADLREQGACRKVAADVAARFGRIDVLVNNCAEQHSEEDFEKISPEQLRKTVETNLFSYVFMSQAALEHMNEGGAIVNTTSVTAYRGSHHLIDYSATKGAIVALTRSMASALVDRGIRVNGVAPGPIWTPLIPASFDAEHVAKFGSGSPMGRAGQPNEVAPCHLFLACADSSYMTGQVLHPNGGEIVGG